jgi:uncharacterized protein (TIGR03083 family)
MKLVPRYDGAAILSIDGPLDDQLEPFIRQRRRTIAMIARLTEEQWRAPSRCEAWTVGDVVAHLVSVNPFWTGSMLAGLDGSPTRLLDGFDPAATPPQLVSLLRDVDPPALLERFVSTSEAMIDVLSSLTPDGWATLAESPPGHVPIRVLVHHALWDSWIHERDIAVPLGITPPAEADEVESCLRYAAAVSPAIGFGVGVNLTSAAAPISLAVEATDLPIEFVMTIGESVSIRSEAGVGLPCLRGGAVSLIESLSLRAPMPDSTPREWTRVLSGLESAFDAVAR